MESNSPDLVIAHASSEFVLPPLPYDYDALNPYIDTQTMMLHHDKHHAGYVKNLNAAIAKYPQWKGGSLKDLLENLDDLPEEIRTAVRNNGGGHANHSLFWLLMSPNGGGQPTGKIAKAIEANFGDFETFQQAFNNAGSKRFGSGWAWLVLKKDGTLAVMSTANQDSPILSGYYPIMGNDVWEHAYYLNYQNRRADYLKAWWNVINWDTVNKQFELASRSFGI
ncbi:MAG: superoxide dismutase [Spirulina sp.]